MLPGCVILATFYLFSITRAFEKFETAYQEAWDGSSTKIGAISALRDEVTNNLKHDLISYPQSTDIHTAIRITEAFQKLVVTAKKGDLKDSDVFELKQTILAYDESLRGFVSPSLTGGREWWKHVFTSIDFLLENRFVSQKAVSDFFEDPRMISHVGSYMEDWLYNDMQHYRFSGSYRLTEHWRWHLLHESFRTLGKDAENFVNMLFMISRYNREADRPSKYSNFRFLFKAHWVKLERWLSLKDSAEDDPAKFNAAKEEAGNDVSKMIKLVATKDNRFLNPQQEQEDVWDGKETMEYVIDLLDMIEDLLFPGLIAPKLQRLTESDSSQSQTVALEFDRRFNLIKYNSQMNYFHRNAVEFYNHIKDNDPFGWSRSSAAKTNFDNHLHKYQDILTQYKEEANRVKLLRPDQDFHKATQEVVDRSEKMLDELQNKSTLWM